MQMKRKSQGGAFFVDNPEELWQTDLRNIRLNGQIPK